MREETWYAAELRERSVLGPHLVRLRFGPPVRFGAEPDLTTFVGSGVPDERVVLELPARPGAAPVQRSYTVAGWDAGAAELVLDVVRHPGGVVAGWAEGARPGARVRVSEPLGWYTPPPGTAWQLLVADLSGLPAVARIAAATSAAMPTRALLEVPTAADRQVLAPATEVGWLLGSGNGLTPSALAAAVADVPERAGPGYVWFAGEASVSRAVRRQLRHDRGWPVARYRSLGYWRADEAAWQRRYTAVAPGLEHVYPESVARGRSSDEALEDYDDALADLGL